MMAAPRRRTASRMVIGRPGRRGAVIRLGSRRLPYGDAARGIHDPPCHPGGDFLAGELVTQSVPVAHPGCGVRESMQECAVPIRVRLEVGGEIQDREAFSLAEG